MINTIIAAVVALFFWGKSTKDIEEKTQLASKTRTAIYFVLSLVVGVFFYKTYQVATIYNGVYLDGIRESRDSAGKVADTISIIRIKNTFSSVGIDNREFHKAKVIANNSELETGGTYVRLRMHYDSPFKIMNNPKIGDATYPNISFHNVGHAYQINTISTAIPILFPLYPSWEDSKIEYPNGNYMNYNIFDTKKHPNLVAVESKKSSIKGDAEWKKVEDFTMDNAVMSATLFAEKESNFNDSGMPLSYFEVSIQSNIINSMGIFTAADISQYNQVFDIQTDCMIDTLEAIYDIPIEITQYDSCMTIGTKGFGISGDYLNKTIRNKGAIFHITLPTLANLQLIRSLILTTLITALISLFFSNLFYLVRRRALKFKEDHITSISEVRVKKFKIRMYWLLALLLGISLYFAWLIYKDSPIHVPVWVFDYIDYIIAVILLFLIIIVYMQFRGAYTTHKKDNNKSKK